MRFRCSPTSGFNQFLSNSELMEKSRNTPGMGSRNHSTIANPIRDTSKCVQDTRIDWFAAARKHQRTSCPRIRAPPSGARTIESTLLRQHRCLYPGQYSAPDVRNPPLLPAHRALMNAAISIRCLAPAAAPSTAFSSPPCVSSGRSCFATAS